MSAYRQVKQLFRDARSIRSCYIAPEYQFLQAPVDLCLAMARNSFTAHSVMAGYDHDVVEAVAVRVFDLRDQQKSPKAA